MTQSNYVLITILVCALCTQVTRWLPFLLFGGKKEVPGLVRYLGTILPAAIMAVLVVYCLKGITPLAYPYGLPELISVAVVVGPPLEGKYPCQHCAGNVVLHDAGTVGILMRL